MRSTITDFLRDDFSDSFDIDVFALNLSSHGRCVGQWSADDKVNLTYSIKCQFEKVRSITVIIGRHDLELEVVEFRIEIGQKLRVGEENVDVFALTMTDLEHHCGAAAE